MRRKNVLVVSHADADGHVIAEQSRRNLSRVPGFNVTTVVDPKRTKDHKSWLHLDELPEIDDSDIVCFVDLMFAPASFGAEADALVRFAKARPSKRFFVFDHHPLPLHRLSAAKNVRATYCRDVFDCTVGAPEPMMIVAALCEKQHSRVRDSSAIDTMITAGVTTKPVDALIAKGVKRAAALGGALPGPKLSALLRFGHWKELKQLGSDDATKHSLPRGRRRADEKPSKLMAQLDKIATDLIKSASPRPKTTGKKTMSYDFEHATDRTAPAVTNLIPNERDLEAIVTLLQLAAIELTPLSGTEFTAKELVERARELGGDEVRIELEDVDIVLGKAGFLKKTSGKKLVLK